MTRQSDSEKSRRYRLKYPEKNKARNRKYRLDNPEKCKESQRKYRLNNPEKSKAKSREYRLNNKESISRKRKKDSLKLKTEIFTHYSKGIPECECCKIKYLVFLTIDHINGGGTKHRQELTKSGKGGGGSKMYRWIKKNNFPEGFRVLCFNCNFAVYQLKICPHKVKDYIR